MPPESILVDSSFLYALADRSDRNHQAAIGFSGEVQGPQLLIPDITLVEVTQVLNSAVGHHAVIGFLKAFTIGLANLIAPSLPDIVRAQEIMEQYQDSRLDFVDCCIVAIAERLNISKICTFDRRDFVIFRPKHLEHFDLLP